MDYLYRLPIKSNPLKTELNVIVERAVARYN